MATFNGILGNDTLTGTGSADTINGLGGNEIIDGGAGNDTIDGGAGNDVLAGGSSDDIMLAGDGNDTMDGGLGVDTASYAGTLSAVTINLTTGKASGGAGLANRIDGGHGIDTVNFNDLITAPIAINLTTGTLAIIENVLSGGGADRLTGNAGANTLDAGAGNDIDCRNSTGSTSLPTAKAPSSTLDWITRAPAPLSQSAARAISTALQSSALTRAASTRRT